jgi:Xaa-Pro aminopeptidase
MPEPHDARRRRLAEAIRAVDADAALVTSLVNVRYLSGYTGSWGALLVRADGEAVLATDGRYITQSAAECPDLEVVIDRDLAGALARRAAEKDGVRRLGFEAHVMTVESRDALAGQVDQVELVPVGHPVEELRRIKDEGELELIRTACRISVEALQAVLPTVAPGRTEQEIARDVFDRMRDLGAEALAFETIVATGDHSAIPHHRPTGRAVARGDLLKIDFGARYAGYHADCTRTFVVGAEPSAWQRDLHALVARAQQAGREALTPGRDTREVDRVARQVIVDAGEGEHFTHGLGHGVGLQIHEAPLMGAAPAGRLADRTPVTVEPGVYLPGRGGVRIEDTLVVRDGAPELLTDLTRDLLVL